LVGVTVGVRVGEVDRVGLDVGAALPFEIDAEVPETERVALWPETIFV
jgi:ABC-type transporter Mla subunit MlaD